MPNIRFTLWLVLGAVLYYNYLAWQQDYKPVPQLTSAAASGAGARGPLGNSVPTPEGAAASAVPGAARCTPRRPPPHPPRRPMRSARRRNPPPPKCTWSPTCSISTSACAAAQIDRADLSQYPLHKDTPNVPVRLENDDPASLYLLQTGLTGAAGEAAPSHLATFTAAQTTYTLARRRRPSCACR